MNSLFARALALTGALTAPVSAQMVWKEQSSATNPSDRAAHATAYQAVRQRVVLFGGVNSNFQRLADTWEWTGSDWTQLPAATSPPPRSDHAMVYDVAYRRVILFGGDDGAGGLADTWEWAGNDWTHVASTGPSPRWGHAMAYDPGRQRIVLCGGRDGRGFLGDIWEWDGTTWTQVAPSTTWHGRSGHAMVYDAARQGLFLFGGYDGVNRLGDTWFNGRRLVPNTSPPARSGHAMVYDATRQRVVLFGGYDGAIWLADTWAWNGSDWTQLFPATSPSARSTSTAYDSARQRTVLFGGANSTNGPFFGDTWTYSPTIRGATAPIGFGCPGSAGTPTLTALGPSIVGNQRFALEVSSVPANASVFVGLSTQLASTYVAPCTIYPKLSFLEVLSSTATGSGVAEVPLPIPWVTTLSGANLFVQGGALDTGAALLGLASLTKGMQIVVGD